MGCTSSGTKAAYSLLSDWTICEAAGGPAYIFKSTDHDNALLRSVRI